MGLTIVLAPLVICRRGGPYQWHFIDIFLTALGLRTRAECYEFYDKNTRRCQIVVNW